MSYFVQRENYRAEYAYFLPNGLYIETLGVEKTYNEAGELISETPFAVKISSDTLTLAELQAILDDHAVLAVNATQTTIEADNADSTTLTIAGQTAFDYTLMRENIVIAASNINDGELEFSTDDKATYLFELKIGSQTGYAEIKAV